MNKIHLALLISVFCSSTVSPMAIADWKAKMAIRSSDGKLNLSADAFAQADLQRFDLVSMGQKVSTLVNVKQYQATLLMHAAKMAMSTTPDPNTSGVLCSTKDIDGCLRKQGLKPKGEEKVGEYLCTVYEGTVKPRGSREKATGVKVWRPKDLKEVAAVKTEFKPAGSAAITIELSEIQEGPLDKSLFAVPADYKKMDGLDIQSLLKLQRKTGATE
jgi:hypothetical protein